VRRPARPWTRDDTRTLRRLARRGLTLREIGERMDRSPAVINDRAERHGIEVVRLCAKTRWSEDEDLILDALYAFSTMDRLRELLPGRTESMIFNRANSRGLKKSAEFMSQTHGARLLSDPRTIESRKGRRTWNAGRTDWMPAASVATRFHPGHRPHTWNPVGHERVTHEGILEIKLTDTGQTRRDYESVPRLVWERERGPIPEGRAVVFKRGLRTTEFRQITVERLECLSRAELMRRNSRHTNYPPEVNRLIQLRGALNRKIRNRKKQHEKQDAGRA
jgi:hypothetical protein